MCAIFLYLYKKICSHSVFFIVYVAFLQSFILCIGIMVPIIDDRHSIVNEVTRVFFVIKIRVIF